MKRSLELIRPLPAAGGRNRRAASKLGGALAWRWCRPQLKRQGWRIWQVSSRFRGQSVNPMPRPVCAVDIDLSGVAAAGLVYLDDGTTIPRRNPSG